MLVYWLDIVGTAVFAISGVLLAGKLRMDPFGVLVLGVVTAVGGGTIRDMALDNGPVFWVKDPTDLVVAMITSMLTILLVRQPRRLPKWILPVLDAVGLAVFVGIGVNKAFLAGTGPLVAICMGVITGVGGGIIRDVGFEGESYRLGLGGEIRPGERKRELGLPLLDFTRLGIKSAPSARRPRWASSSPVPLPVLCILP